MYKETQLANQQPTRFLDYPELFSVSEPMSNRIVKATARLGIMLSQPVDSLSLQGWAQRLSVFSPEQLTQAFVIAESTLHAWPVPAKLMDLIFEKEFSADYAWILLNLKRHKVEWKDTEEVYYPQEFEDIQDSEGNWKRIMPPRKLKTPVIPAPEIPKRIQRALERYSRSTVQRGLEKLSDHPQIDREGTREMSAAELIRIEEGIDRPFRKAWNQARYEFLGGGAE